VICVPSVVELPNEYVLLESICGRTVVMEEPAKTVIPAVARLDLAEAPPAASDALRTTIASNKMMRENRNVAPFYAVYASSAFEAWSMVSAVGNERLKVLPPAAVVKYAACCASQAAIWARAALRPSVWMPAIAPR